MKRMKAFSLYSDHEYSVHLTFDRPYSYVLGISACPEELIHHPNDTGKHCCDKDFELPPDEEGVLVRKTYIFKLSLIFWSVSLEFTRRYE